MLRDQPLSSAWFTLTISGAAYRVDPNSGVDLGRTIPGARPVRTAASATAVAAA